MNFYQKFLSKSFAVLTLMLLVFSSQAQKIDIQNSTVQWKGYHLAKSYEHVGQVKIKSGEVIMEDGMLKGGKVVIDMTSITNEDLEEGKNSKLVNHLKSDDFFYTEKFPEATLVLTKVNKTGEDYNVTGVIEIRGIKEPVEFTLTQSGKSFRGNLSVDRTKHEVLYGWSLENMMLGNTFDLEVDIKIK